MVHKEERRPVSESTSRDQPSASEVIGPFGVFNQDWGAHLIVQALGCDSDNRIYAIVARIEVIAFYLVRISSEGTLGGGVADLDLEFGEDGFAPISVDGLAVSKGLQVVRITPSHVTLCVEVLDETTGLFQTALFRFLLDGQPDVIFGGNGFVIFPQLPDPSLAHPVVTLTAGLQQPGLLTSVNQSVSAPRHKEKLHEPVSAIPGVTGDVLANGQVLLVAYKKMLFKGKISCLVKVNEDGTLDSSYAAGAGYIRLSFTGSFDESTYTLSVDSRERATLVSEAADGARCLATRLDAEGSLDLGFGGGGFIQFSSGSGSVYAPAIKVDSDDRAVISVCYRSDGPGGRAVYVYRLGEGGASDPTFNNGSPVEITLIYNSYLATALDIDERQNVVLRGRCDYNGPIPRATVVSRCNAQGLDSGFGESGHFILQGQGELYGGLVSQPGSGIVATDHSHMWRIVL
jgi:hypothetical protein